jgi:hypothetical protein
VTAGTVAPARWSDADALDMARAVIERPRIFVIGNLFGSAGSFFLHTLLDNHPDVLTFLYDLRRAPVFVDDFDRHSKADHVRALLEDNDRLFDTGSVRHFKNTLSALGATRDRSIVTDRGAFAHYLRLILDDVPFNIRNHCLALALAHNFARGVRPGLGAVVFYAHDLPRALLFVRQFGEGRVLALVRHPVNVHASRNERLFKDALAVVGDPHVDRRAAMNLALYLPSRMLYLEDFYRLLGESRDPIGVVSIEELHAHPRESVERLAQFMGIPFRPTLLESTIGGLAWWGSHYTRVQGFSRTLHREMALEKAGRGDATAITLATGGLHRHCGYATAGTSRLERLRARLPGRRFPRDVIALWRRSWATTPGWRPRLAATRMALERIVKYAIARTTVENAALARLARLDAAGDFSRLTLVNPLQADSMRGVGDGLRGVR